MCPKSRDVQEGYRAVRPASQAVTAPWLSVVFALNAASITWSAQDAEAGQQTDLAGEGSSVVVDGVVLDEPVGDLHHVDAADVDLAPGRGDALERAAGVNVPAACHWTTAEVSSATTLSTVIVKSGKATNSSPKKARTASCPRISPMATKSSTDPGAPMATMPSGSFPLTASKAARPVSRSTCSSGAHSSPSMPGRARSAEPATDHHPRRDRARGSPQSRLPHPQSITCITVPTRTPLSAPT